MGHMGYYYMENEIQTGMYSVQYVHNDLLQIGLDLGLIPMLLYVAAVVYCLAGKQIPHDKKLILLVVFLHGLLDFDLAYSVILCMVFMVMDDRMIMWKDWKISQTIHIRGKQWLAVSGVLWSIISVCSADCTVSGKDEPCHTVVSMGYGS